MAEQWLAVIFPALAAELWNLDGTLPGVWIAETRQRVWQMDAGAANQGIQIGMSAAQARALAPQLQVMQRDAEREFNLLDRCAQLLYAWGPQVVALQEWPHALAVELQGNSRWRARPQSLLQAIREFAGERLRVRLGLAPTSLAAALLAWQGEDGELCHWPADRSFTECWQEIPLKLLPANNMLHVRWESLGLYSCGDWLRLDRRERALRFGPEWESFLDRLRGIRADPRSPWPLQEEFAVAFPLLQEVSDWQGLRFPLRRAFQELRLRLRHRASTRWELLLQGRDAQYRQLLHSRDPLTSAELFLQLWRERLQRHPWGFAARHLQLRAMDTENWAGEQGAFWEQNLLREQGQLLDRLRARLGVDSIYRVRPRADHRPEYAWHSVVPEDSETNTALPDLRPRPLWLLPEPIPVSVLHEPETTELERIEGGWWDGHDVSRDYFRWRRSDGAECWVFRDRRSARYFLHGYFA